MQVKCLDERFFSAKRGLILLLSPQLANCCYGPPALDPPKHLCCLFPVEISVNSLLIGCIPNCCCAIMASLPPSPPFLALRSKVHISDDEKRQTVANSLVLTDRFEKPL